MLCSQATSLPGWTSLKLTPATSEPVSLYSKKQLLSPLDYLNASASDPAPFEFCPVFGPGDEIAERRGQWGLLKSRLHTGSGARVQKVIQKAMAGQPISISVLGGSGMSQDPSRTPFIHRPPRHGFIWRRTSH